MTDDLRTRAREAAERKYPISGSAGGRPMFSKADLQHLRRVAFIEGALWHASQQPTREQVKAERDAALDDRDIWRIRWRMLMAEYKRTERDRDRLYATVERVEESLDRLLLPHQETGELTGRQWQFAADYIRAAIEGTDS